MLPLFRDRGFDPNPVIEVETCHECRGWDSTLLEASTPLKPVLVIICLAEVRLSRLVPKSPVKAKPFTSHFRTAETIQTAYVLISGLWARGNPFAAIIPALEGSIVACLRQLPGLRWTTGESLIILHSVPEDSVITACP